MKLTVVRHGQTVENVNNIVQGQSHGTLTDEGHRQAKELVEKLKGRQFDVIYSSDLKRCTDTAEYILKFHPTTPFELTESLREHSFGSYHGKPSSEVDWVNIPGDTYNRKPGGGESLIEGRDRVRKFLAETYKAHPNKSVLFVTHGGPIRIIRQFLLTRPAEELRTFEMENCAIFNFEISEPVVLTPLNIM